MADSDAPGGGAAAPGAERTHAPGMSPRQPLRLLLITLLGAFLVEASVMLVVGDVQPFSLGTRALLDATVLTLLLVPVYYVFVFRPMVRQMRALQRTACDNRSLIAELRSAAAKVKTLSGMLPICAACNKIRDGRGDWHRVEAYISDHSEAVFTHGICPACGDELYGRRAGRGEPSVS